LSPPESAERLAGTQSLGSRAVAGYRAIYKILGSHRPVAAPLEASMSWTAHTSSDLPTPAGPYSHVVDAGTMVWTAGFGPQDPSTGAIPDGIRAQTEQVLDNVERALAAVGLGLSDVVKATVHLQHLDRDFAAYNEVYARRFHRPYPVRTTVGSSLTGMLIEVDVVALRPAADTN
jgi:2-iminobutanoate/2-iminopropanoate deaminase